MYQFKPVTKRIQHMHDLIRDRVIQVDSERAMITTDVVRDYEHMIPAILSLIHIYNRTLRE